jgi:hypothetical protein
MVRRSKDHAHQEQRWQEVIITMADVRAAKMCAKGARVFFRRHGLDWSTFIKEGLHEQQIAATGDAMALKVIEVAHERRR